MKKWRSYCLGACLMAALLFTGCEPNVPETETSPSSTVDLSPDSSPSPSSVVTAPVTDDSGTESQSPLPEGTEGEANDPAAVN